MPRITYHLASALLLTIALAPAATAQGGVTRYCPSGATGATISCTGSTDFSVNGGSGDLVLHASGLPAGALGQFFYGPQAVPATPLGSGFLCVGGGASVGRLGVVAVAPGADRVSTAVDYLAPPHQGALISPGSTWNFQFWFRAPGGADTTDAVQVEFGRPVPVDPVVFVAQIRRSGHPLGQTTGGVVIINTDAELRAFWTLHSTGFQPMPPLPPVDLTQSTVIAVFAGRRFTLGHAIVVTDISLSVTTVHVRSEESVPCGGSLPSESQPLVMVAVRKITGAVLGSWSPTVLVCP